MENSYIYDKNYRATSYLKNYNYYRPSYNSYNSNLNSNYNSSDYAYDSVTSPLKTSFSSNYESKEEKKSKNNFTNFNLEHLLCWNLDEPIFEIFGIKLFLDDLIILAILFFLYTEGVTDQMVYISLILLIIG